MSAFWILGCGNMGGALLSRWLETGLDPASVTVIDPAPRQIEGVRWVASLPADEPPPELLMLGIKPQMLSENAPVIAAVIGPQTTVISILAGVECATLRRHFPAARAILRVMPNLPVRLGKGATGLFLEGGDTSIKQRIDTLFEPTGLVEWLNDEDLFHPLTAVSGSGPAFVYRFIEAMAVAGSQLGLAPEQALRLALATVEGAGAMARSADVSPSELAARVASPGGTTARGLAILDKDQAILDLLQATLDATDARSREMGEEARALGSKPSD